MPPRLLPAVASRLIRSAAAALLGAAACVATAQQPPVGRLTCGAYEAVPSGTASNGQPTRLGIQRNGRLLATVGDWSISRVDCADVDADGTFELLVSTSSGSSRCCETLHVWALGAKPQKLIEYAAGHAAGFALRDLDGDGRQELLVGDDTFAFYGDLCDTCAPGRLPLILCRTERGFEDCTRRFPDELKKALASFTDRLSAPATSADRQMVEGAALGALAVWALLGDEEKGLESIRAHVASDDVMKWLERARPQVRDWVAARGRRIRNER